MSPARKLRVLPGGVPPAAAADKLPRFQALFESVSDAIVTVGPGCRVIDANRAAAELTGYLAEELRGGSALALASAPEAPAGIAALPTRARRLQPELFAQPGTYEDVAIYRKDGFPRFVDLSVRLVDSDEGELAVAVLRDTTERQAMERELITKHQELRSAFTELERSTTELKAAQEQLVQAGKMAALGELAAGIAHEINQPLQMVRGYAQELQTGSLSPAEQALGLKEIVSAVDKMAAIISHLRSFVRKSTEGMDWVDVGHVLDEAFKMMGRQLQSRGIVVTRAGASARVWANPTLLEQVFINLASNARDAIEATSRGSGSITVTVREDGAFVETRFRDDGVGMADRTKAKAFNPFFTTKEVGKGMGLGLSLSYGIVSRLHGSIIVESELGRGTEFIVRVPKDFRELG